MTGKNVWVITLDLFNVSYFKQLDISESIKNPKEVKESNSLSNPYQM